MREFQDCLRRPQYILTHQYIEGNHPSPQLHLNFTSTSPQIHLSWSRFDKHALQMKIIPNSLNELFPSWHTNKWVGGEKAIDHSFCQSCFPPLCYLLPGNYHLFSPVHTSSTATTVLTFGILGNSFLFWPIASQKHENLIVGKIIELQVCIYRDAHHQYI